MHCFFVLYKGGKCGILHLEGFVELWSRRPGGVLQPPESVMARRKKGHTYANSGPEISLEDL